MSKRRSSSSKRGAPLKLLGVLAGLALAVFLLGESYAFLTSDLGRVLAWRFVHLGDRAELVRIVGKRVHEGLAQARVPRARRCARRSSRFPRAERRAGGSGCARRIPPAGQLRGHAGGRARWRPGDLGARTHRRRRRAGRHARDRRRGPHTAGGRGHAARPCGAPGGSRGARTRARRDRALRARRERGACAVRCLLAASRSRWQCRARRRHASRCGTRRARPDTRSCCRCPWSPRNTRR